MVVFVLYGFLIEPNWIEITHFQIEQPCLAEALQGKIALHLTDLHIEKLGWRERKILQIIDDLNPDIIFLTGDYVAWGGDYEPALEFLSRLKAKEGVWAVMGDYDYSNDRKSCLFCHEYGTARPTNRHGVRFLRNSLEMIGGNGETLYIAGLEMGAATNQPDTWEWPALTTPAATIVLVHNPLAFDAIDTGEQVLILSGDTHGGQVPLPRWIWELVGYEKNAKYNYGRFRDTSKTMFVSKGIGTSRLPIRLFQRPEIVVLHF